MSLRKTQTDRPDDIIVARLVDCSCVARVTQARYVDDDWHDQYPDGLYSIERWPRGTLIPRADRLPHTITGHPGWPDPDELTRAIEDLTKRALRL